MVRFGNDPERFFAAVHEGSAPWDTGAPQPALTELLTEYPVQDPVLYLGSDELSSSGATPSWKSDGHWPPLGRSSITSTTLWHSLESTMWASARFDGGGGVVGWMDATESAAVTVELVRRGYSEEFIRKIWGGNLLRVWREVQQLGEYRR